MSLANISMSDVYICAAFASYEMKGLASESHV